MSRVCGTPSVVYVHLCIPLTPAQFSAGALETRCGVDWGRIWGRNNAFRNINQSKTTVCRTRHLSHAPQGNYGYGESVMLQPSGPLSPWIQVFSRGSRIAIIVFPGMRFQVHASTCLSYFRHYMTRRLGEVSPPRNSFYAALRMLSGTIKYHKADKERHLR